MKRTLVIETDDTVVYSLQDIYERRPEHLRTVGFSEWLGLFLSEAVDLRAFHD